MDWYNFVSQLLSWEYNYFWSMYNDISHPILKMIFLGMSSIFTPSLLTINLFFTAYIVIQMGKQKWMREVTFVLIGKILGGLLFILFLRIFNDIQVLMILELVRKSMGIFILFVGFLSLFSIKVELKVALTRWLKGFVLGVFLSFLTGPSVFSVLRGYSIIYEDGMLISILIFSLIFSVISLTPFILVSLVIYGFELDLLFKKRIILVRYIITIFFILLGINELVFYWL